METHMSEPFPRHAHQESVLIHNNNFNTYDYLESLEQNINDEFKLRDIIDGRDLFTFE